MSMAPGILSKMAGGGQWLFWQASRHHLLMVGLGTLWGVLHGPWGSTTVMVACMSPHVLLLLLYPGCLGLSAQSPNPTYVSH